jgi:tripartite-type tricarboxylate transporter receptor subunit TctC
MKRRTGIARQRHHDTLAAPPGFPPWRCQGANAALADLEIKARFAELSGMVLGGTPADFGKHIAEETEKWSKVIRTANIKPE